ncbi:MAG: hypothetical protein M5R36_02835 [Deltaproteobacteria bacterium]|nr:hypothetical protein [Deltaproteobacteria bacterium]
MSLSDIMSHMRYAEFAVVGLVVSMFAFGLIGVYLTFSRNKKLWTDASRMPLNGDEAVRQTKE